MPNDQSPISNEGRTQFNKYLSELIEWNKKFNLTSITDPEAIRRKHFEDSLLLLKVLPLTNQSVVDVGTGAGFPGLPLKISSPNIKLTLLEATRKKVDFLNQIVKLLDLKETSVFWTRAEDYAAQGREQFDLAVARAVANLNVLAEYCLPLVVIGGFFVAYKEVAIDSEIVEAREAISILGGQLQEVRKFASRSLVVIKKIAPTPIKYPRRAGMAKKHPL